MKLKRTATKATLMGAMSIAAAGFGGSAQGWRTLIRRSRRRHRGQSRRLEYGPKRVGCLVER